MKSYSLWTLLLLLLCLCCCSVCQIAVKTTLDGIKLTCFSGHLYKNDEQVPVVKTNTMDVTYSDDQSGEYVCNGADDKDIWKIFVKFRTCDNCIELDVASIMGIAAGEVLVTLAIGVGVYLVASHSAPAPTQNTSFERKHNEPSERAGAATDGHYQRLRYKKGAQRDEYDFINRR